MRSVRCRSGAAPDRGWRFLLQISIALVLVFAAAGPAVADEGFFGFFGYLFKLLFADEIPQPPPLTPADREAIAKMEVLLHEQNADRRTAANYLLLGILAATRRDEDLAVGYLRSAAAVLPEWSLPSTVAGQVRAQASDFDGSLQWHRRAGQQIRSSPFLAANNHMDLAVVYANVGQRERAITELAVAREQLARPQRQRTPAALGWLQVGRIYAVVLKDAEAARNAWQTGREVLEEPQPGVEAFLRADIDLRIADAYAVEGNLERADVFLRSALQVLNRTPDNLRPQLQLRVGTGYARLADQQPEVTRYADEALSQLNPLAEQLMVVRVKDRPVDLGQLQIFRSAALISAGLQQDSDPARARELTREAFRATLELGESDLERPAFQLKVEDLLDRRDAVELLPPIERQRVPVP